MGSPFLWINRSLAPADEYSMAEAAWGKFYTPFRSCIPAGSTVFARYGTVPYPFELEAELRERGSKCINPATATQSIAGFGWYRLFEEARIPTPKTWFEWDDFSTLPEGRYVAKGRANSRKWDWDTHMYADTVAEVVEVRKRLYDDPFIAEQGLAVRRFVDFESYGKDVRGMPVTNEWRVFCLNGEHVASGFYWANWVDELKERRPNMDWDNVPSEAVECAVRAAKALPYPFVAIDVARVSAASYGLSDANSAPEVDSALMWDGGWMVVEVNDGCMSGLCTIEPEAFYLALRKATMGW